MARFRKYKQKNCPVCKVAFTPTGPAQVAHPGLCTQRWRAMRKEARAQRLREAQIAAVVERNAGRHPDDPLTDEEQADYNALEAELPPAAEGWEHVRAEKIDALRDRPPNHKRCDMHLGMLNPLVGPTYFTTADARAREDELHRYRFPVP